MGLVNNKTMKVDDLLDCADGFTMNNSLDSNVLHNSSLTGQSDSCHMITLRRQFVIGSSNSRLHLRGSYIR
ncbi:hypothetical protein DERF_009889 [Dermatophagoides farinae]|uniref:Uncharacterized protein n=1 Tax=Dermatophagoides farinae TaxID=6954 RepID=A0A922HUX6_DERFA|nr:hypothetical protein DERF_009889 [Dermatophagoides farinae]